MNSTLIVYFVIGIIISLFLFYNFYTPQVYTYDSVSKDKGKTIIPYKINIRNTNNKKIIYKLDSISFKYKLRINIAIDKSICENKSCAKVFYEKAMEDYNKLSIE